MSQTTITPMEASAADIASAAEEPGASSGAPQETGRTQARLGVLGLRVLSVLLMLGLWEIASRAVTGAVLPSPTRVLFGLQAAYADGYMISDLVITLGRMLSAFALAMLVAIAGGFAIGTVRWFGRMFDFWVTIAASIPSLLFIIVAYLWLGLNDTAAIVAAAIVVAPSAMFNVIQGVRAIDPGLSEMARAFQIPQVSIIRRVLFPQTLPYLFAAARACLALTWKIVIFVELMGRSSGVGYRIQYFYNLFNMERVLASALPFMAVMLIIELVVLRQLEHFLFRWRREEAR